MPSGSLAASVIETAASSGVETEAGVAMGARLPEAIAREIVAGAEKTVPSKTRKVKESEPTNPELAR